MRFTKKTFSGLMATVVGAVALTSCGSSASSDGAVEINFPTMWVGVNQSAPYFKSMVEEFNATNEGKYKVVMEEIPGDQAYVDKLKVLYSSNSLPDMIAAGGYNTIDTMKDQLIDLTPYVDDEWLSTMSDVGVEVNSRDGKLYGIPFSRQVIGYYYNTELLAEVGVTDPSQMPQTWDEFFALCDDLVAAGITPLSMDTADSGWLTSLWLGAMVGSSSDEGEVFMNTLLPESYDTPEMLYAVTNIQKMFEKYTTNDAIGGKYENGASNFFQGKTAMIANGPWMVSDFKNTDIAPEGFMDKVGAAVFPGDLMYDSGKIGFNVAAKTPEKIEATIEFIKFYTSKESQKALFEASGDTPDSPDVDLSGADKLTQSIIANGNNSTRKINDFQSIWHPAVVDEISVQYPLLAQGTITPEEFIALLNAKISSAN